MTQESAWNVASWHESVGARTQNSGEFGGGRGSGNEISRL